MIKVLVDNYYNALSRNGLGFLRVFLYPEFSAIFALILAFAIVVLLGDRVIRWLVRQKIGDNPEFYHADLNELMKIKTNTPTMGGLLISGAILACTLLLADIRTFYVHMAILALVWLSALGAADDWLKLTSTQRGEGRREGLYAYEKLLFQLGLAIILGLFIHHHGVTKYHLDFDEMSRMTHSLTLPFLKTWEFDTEQARWLPAESLITLGAIPFVLIAIVVMVGSSNAVNLTDGMDGLAAGIMAIVAFAFMVLCLIAGEQQWAQTLLVPYIPLSEELAIVAGAIVGSCLGFLWFNCAPARVFMGDTGSLPLGGLIGYIAVVIRQEFLLLIIGGIFVFEALSVIMQVSYFKMTGGRHGGGRKIFRCSPIHHHFHLGGWAEQQVVVRFWLVTAILTAVALATIRLR